MIDLLLNNLRSAFVLLLFSPTISLATECKLTDLNDPIKVIVEFQNCDQLAPALLSSFKVSDFPVALTGVREDFNSVIVVQKGIVVGEIKLSQPLVLQNGLYEFHNPASPNQNINVELNSFLDTLNLKEALIWNVGLKFPLQNTPLESWGIKIHLALMVHEGFHFFAQQLSRIPINWPRTHLGLSEEVRTQTQEKCFNLNPGVQNLAKLERQKILDAFAFSQLGDVVNAKSNAVEFLQARKLRYSNLIGIEILDTDLSILTCQEAENFASIVEGIPEFVGIATLLKLRLVTTNEVANYFPEKDSALYYRFPLFQALVLTSKSTDLLLKTLDYPEFGLSNAFEEWLKN